MFRDSIPFFEVHPQLFHMFFLQLISKLCLLYNCQAPLPTLTSLSVNKRTDKVDMERLFSNQAKKYKMFVSEKKSLT